MAAAGVLRALNRSIVSGIGLDFISRLRRSAEDRIESVAREIISRTRGFTSLKNDLGDSLLLQCISVALARSGAISARTPLFICVASALLTEIFPLRSFYMNVLKSMNGSSAALRIHEVREHQESLTFKEAGAIAGVFCNQYLSVKEQSQSLVENLVWDYFGKVVAPTMFLYMGHPNGKVARASHSLFSAFISSGKDSDQNERESLKEQLVFYYIQRSLMKYPDITPFEGMATGVAALVRHLPAGSPAIFFCIHSLAEKANRFCIEDFAHQTDMWKNWQGESEPCKKILDLLLRLISLVDRQVS